MQAPSMEGKGRGGPEIGSHLIAGGITTNYHDAGDGPPVVLLHGSGPGVSAWANWRLVIPALAPSHRVVAPDLVGFGFTEPPTDIVYDLDTWIAHLEAFLDALEVDTLSLVGNSFGGALALAFTARHPERVSKLVLMGSAGIRFPLTDALDAIWGYEPTPERMRQMLELLVSDRSIVTDELVDLRFRASLRDGVQEAYRAMFPAPREHGIDALATPEAEIAGISQETLVIHGRDDQVVPWETSVRLSDLIRGSELHVFGACGHWVQIERTDRFNQLLSGFLAS
jgi:2-hydroxymuconate-semialdehyde hydrolase